jgi:hypothetical protein
MHESCPCEQPKQVHICVHAHRAFGPLENLSTETGREKERKTQTDMRQTNEKKTDRDEDKQNEGQTGDRQEKNTERK